MNQIVAAKRVPTKFGGTFCYQPRATSVDRINAPTGVLPDGTTWEVTGGDFSGSLAGYYDDGNIGWNQVNPANTPPLQIVFSNPVNLTISAATAPEVIGQGTSSLDNANQSTVITTDADEIVYTPGLVDREFIINGGVVTLANPGVGNQGIPTGRDFGTLRFESVSDFEFQVVNFDAFTFAVEHLGELEQRTAVTCVSPSGNTFIDQMTGEPLDLSQIERCDGEEPVTVCTCEETGVLAAPVYVALDDYAGIVDGTGFEVERGCGDPAIITVELDRENAPNARLETVTNANIITQVPALGLRPNNGIVRAIYESTVPIDWKISFANLQGPVNGEEHVIFLTTPSIQPSTGVFETYPQGPGWHNNNSSTPSDFEWLNTDRVELLFNTTNPNISAHNIMYRGIPLLEEKCREVATGPASEQKLCELLDEIRAIASHKPEVDNGLNVPNDTTGFALPAIEVYSYTVTNQGEDDVTVNTGGGGSVTIKGFNSYTWGTGLRCINLSGVTVDTGSDVNATVHWERRP